MALADFRRVAALPVAELRRLVDARWRPARHHLGPAQYGQPQKAGTPGVSCGQSLFFPPVTDPPAGWQHHHVAGARVPCGPDGSPIQ
jgi:hypothetical protein